MQLPPLLPRPRTDRQRRASIALVNVVFVVLMTWLLGGNHAAGIDKGSTASVPMSRQAR